MEACGVGVGGRVAFGDNAAKRNQICGSFFPVYGDDGLLIGGEGYLSRSSPWLRPRWLQPSDRPRSRPPPLSSFYLEERK